MNAKILLPLLTVAVLSGCASTKKASNNPADVYGSSNVDNSGTSEYENYVSDNDDEYLRMKVQNNSLWSTIDDNSYWNDSRYDFGYSCSPSDYSLMNPMFYPGYGWNSMFGYGFGYGFGWTNWYSPYQTIVFYRSPTVYFTTPGNKGTTPAAPATPITKSMAKTGLTAYKPFNYSPVANARYLASRPSSSTGSYTNTRSFTTPRSYTPTSTSSFGSSRSMGSGGSIGGGGARMGGGGGMGHH